jgi:NCS2 family nucleobase:cation symporter-2
MVATGVTSRRIAIAFGAAAVTLAFFPRFSAILATTPPPVVGGALLFSSTFTLMSGLQIITSRLIDARKTLVIGLALTTALAVYSYPSLGSYLPRHLQPLVGSALVAATIVGILLTILFRIGVRRRVLMSLSPDDSLAQTIEDFGLKNGSAWGARPEVIRRAIFALTQLTEAVIDNCNLNGPIAVEARFDEFNLDIHVSYDGDPLEFPDVRPSNQEILESDRGARRLAGFMLRRNADRIAASSQDGKSRVHFHFDH